MQPRGEALRERPRAALADAAVREVEGQRAQPGRDPFRYRPRASLAWAENKESRRCTNIEYHRNIFFEISTPLVY